MVMLTGRADPAGDAVPGGSQRCRERDGCARAGPLGRALPRLAPAPAQRAPAGAPACCPSLPDKPWARGASVPLLRPLAIHLPRPEHVLLLILALAATACLLIFKTQRTSVSRQEVAALVTSLKWDQVLAEKDQPARAASLADCANWARWQCWQCCMTMHTISVVLSHPGRAAAMGSSGSRRAAR